MDVYPLIRIYPDKTAVEERVSKLEEQLAEKNNIIASLMSNGAKKTNEIGDLRDKLERLESIISDMVTSDYFKKTPIPECCQ